MQLVTTNLGGNLHVAAGTLNHMGLADYVLTMDFSGSSTTVVLRVPDAMAPELRRHLGTLPEYCANPKPELDW